MLTLLTVVAFALGFIAGRTHARTAYTHGLTRAFRLVDAESKKARVDWAPGETLLSPSMPWVVVGEA